MLAAQTPAVDVPPAEEFARTLARFTHRLTLERLPMAVRTAVKANIFDTLICAAAGSGAAGVTELTELVREWGGAPQARLLVHGDALPAHHAALVNGTMAHARDYDDTHDEATLHGGVTAVTAALAAAQLRGSVAGGELLSAVAAGLESICRLGMSTTVGIVDSGYMYTALFGYFAATVSAGRVLELDEAQLVNALGIVYSQAAGNHQVTRDAALTKRMQPGFAAMSGLLAVQLARKGVRGVQSTFEGQDGLLRVYLHDHCDRGRLRAGLGDQFDLLGLSYKPYPCCRFTHTAIDAARALRSEIAAPLDEIVRIRVEVNRLAHEVVCTPQAIRKAPTTVVQAQFSIPYAVAALLLDGEIRLDHFADAALGRPEIRALSSRVETAVADDIEKDWGRRNSPARMTIDLRDGRTLRTQVDWALGHPRNPMSEADFDRKAVDCLGIAARPLADDAARTLRDRVSRLETLADVRSLIDPLISRR